MISVISYVFHSKGWSKYWDQKCPSATHFTNSSINCLEVLFLALYVKVVIDAYLLSLNSGCKDTIFFLYWPQIKPSEKSLILKHERTLKDIIRSRGLCLLCKNKKKTHNIHREAKFMYFCMLN